MVLIAGALVPNETPAIREIVGTVPVDALSQRRTAAQAPSGFALGRPEPALNLIQGRAAAGVADDLFKPAPQLLQEPALNLIQGPGMTRQAMVDRVGLDDGVGELVELLVVKGGSGPRCDDR